MTEDELRAELASILQLEEQEKIDWKQVEARCVELVKRLNSELEPPYPYDVVYHFIEDTDVRQKSTRYAITQRERLRDWLASP